MRKNGMDAGFRFDWRVGVQFVIYFVAFHGNREKVGIGNRIERIARLFCAHPTAQGSVVIAVRQGEDHQQRIANSYQ